MSEEKSKPHNGCLVLVIYLIATAALGLATGAVAKISTLEKRIQALESKP